MEDGKCMYCGFCNEEITYSKISHSKFKLLVKECEDKEAEKQKELKEKVDEEETCDKDSVIKWLHYYVSKVKLEPIQNQNLLQTFKNYKENELVKFLYDQGVYIETIGENDKNTNALDIAARLGNPKIIACFLAFEQHKNKNDDYNNDLLLALFVAAVLIQNNTKRVIKLLPLYIDLLNKNDFFLEQTINISAKEGYFDSIKYLYENILYINKNDQIWLEAFNTVIENEHYHIAQWFVDNGLNLKEQDDSKNNSIHYAAINGKIEVIKWLIKLGVDLFCKDEEGNSVLYLAAKYGHLNLMKWLMKKGFDIEERNNGCPLIHIAAKNGHYECVEFLVHYIDVDIFERDKENKATVLHGACCSGNIESVKFLIDHGANIYALDGSKNSVLHVAAKHIEIVKFLVIEKGCDVDFENNDNEDLLYVAFIDKSYEVIEWLIEENKVKFNSVLRILHISKKKTNFKDIDFGNVYNKLLKFLLGILSKWDLTEIYDDFETLLHRSVFHIEAVKLLLAHNADVNVLDKCGNTPLHTALKCGQLEVAEYLIKNGADVHIKNKFDDTILCLAVEKCKDDISLVEQIVELGSDVNATFIDDDKTPLYIAVEVGSSLSCVQYLVSKGADINAEIQTIMNGSVIENAARSKQWEILEYLMSEDSALVSMDQFNYILYCALADAKLDVVEWLVERCPDIEYINVNIENYKPILQNCDLFLKDETLQFELVQSCLKYGAVVDAIDEFGNPILHRYIDNYKFLKLLIEYGANVNHPLSSDNGKYECLTPINTIMYYYQETKYTEKILDNGISRKTYLSVKMTKPELDIATYNIISLLLQNQADPNIKEFQLRTSLHFAAMHTNCQDIVKLLIKFDADVNAKDDNGDTFLHTMNFGAPTTWLINKYASIVNIRNRNGQNVLHNAVEFYDYIFDDINPDINSVQWVQNRSIQIKQHPQVTSSLLTNISRDSYIQNLQCIISHTKNINGKNNKRFTALHLAAECDNITAFKCLIQHNANINADNNHGNNVLHEATFAKETNIVKFILSLNHPQLLNTLNKNLETPLMCAVTNQNTEAVKLLLEHDVVVNAKNKKQLNELHIAVRDGNLEIVKMLVEKKCDIFLCDLHNKMTPIHYAVRHCHLSILKFLISTAKTNHRKKYLEMISNMKYKKNTSLLRVAIRNKKDTTRIIKYLISLR